MPVSPERRRELRTPGRTCGNCQQTAATMIQWNGQSIAICGRCVGALRKIATAKPAITREE